MQQYQKVSRRYYNTSGHLLEATVPNEYSEGTTIFLDWQIGSSPLGTAFSGVQWFGLPGKVNAEGLFSFSLQYFD